MLKRGSTLVQVSWKWLCQCLRVVPKQSNFTGIGMSFDTSYHYWGWFKNGKFEGLGIQISKNGSLYMVPFLSNSKSYSLRGSGITTRHKGSAFIFQLVQGTGTKAISSKEILTVVYQDFGNW